ncbi:unnamed protein product [Adineta steineri]|uniref:NHL repeat containing protein n=1 Tax=Adineta steineri TaxID=433720 RepID=A0A813TRD6_9BILA|nr:unnamed protein product [Adineta steineri]CAF1424781.1 unnamed protein product [Adineta steineri]
MNDKKQNNDNFHSINDEITPTSTDQSRISYENTSQITAIATTTETTAAAGAITAAATTTAVITTEELSFTSISNNSYLKWKLNFSIVAGDGVFGHGVNQITMVEAIYVDDDKQTIYIAAYNTDRIAGWKFGEKGGEIVAGGKGQGNNLDQLNNPSDVTVDKKNDLLIICDKGNKRVVQWSRQKQIGPKIIIDKIKCQGVTADNNGDIYVSEGETHSVKQLKQGEAEGTIVAGGNGRGCEPNQLNNPAYIFVDKQYSIYVSDDESGRVTKWIKNAKEGIIITNESISENDESQSADSYGMAVDHFGNVYVSEYKNNRIVRWSETSKEGYIIINGGSLAQPPQLFSSPTAISLDRKGNLYVVDHFGYRIVKFNVDVN